MDKKIIASVVAVLAAFGSGYYLSNLQWERDYAEFKLKAEKSYVALFEAKERSDREARERTASIETDYLAKINEQKQNYEKTISNLRANFKPSGVSNCPSSGDSMPRTDSDTSDLVCYRTRDLQSRIEETLAIGRRADELAVRYNALLELVKKHD